MQSKRVGKAEVNVLTRNLNKHKKYDDKYDKMYLCY